MNAGAVLWQCIVLLIECLRLRMEYMLEIASPNLRRCLFFLLFWPLLVVSSGFTSRDRPAHSIQYIKQAKISLEIRKSNASFLLFSCLVPLFGSYLHIGECFVDMLLHAKEVSYDYNKWQGIDYEQRVHLDAKSMPITQLAHSGMIAFIATLLYTCHWFYIRKYNVAQAHSIIDYIQMLLYTTFKHPYLFYYRTGLT